MSDVLFVCLLFGFGPATILLAYALRGFVDSGPIYVVGIIMTISIILISGSMALIPAIAPHRH